MPLETLEDRITRNGALNELDAVGWVIRLVKRLEAIHTRGAVHGSISPACVQTGGVPRTSKGALADRTHLLSSGLYHSPERVKGASASAADDAWAVGLTLYTILTGTNPFEAGTESESRRKILAGVPLPLSAFEVGDDDLQRIVDQLLTPDAGRRLSDLSHLRRELETWHPDPAAHELTALDDEDNAVDDDPQRMVRANHIEPLPPVQVVVRDSPRGHRDGRDAPAHPRKGGREEIGPSAASPQKALEPSTEARAVRAGNVISLDKTQPVSSPPAARRAPAAALGIDDEDDDDARTVQRLAPLEGEDASAALLRMGPNVLQPAPAVLSSALDSTVLADPGATPRKPSGAPPPGISLSHPMGAAPFRSPPPLTRFEPPRSPSPFNPEAQLTAPQEPVSAVRQGMLLVVLLALLIAIAVGTFLIVRYVRL